MVPVLKMEVSSRRGTPGTRAVRAASRHWPFRAVPEPPSVQVGVEIRLQGVMRMYACGDLTTPCRRPAQRIVYYAGFIREHAFQTGPADIPALPLLVLVVSVLNLVSRPLQNAISRRVERAADRTALELTNDLADFAPPRVVVLLLHAHPPPRSSGSAWPRPSRLGRPEAINAHPPATLFLRGSPHRKKRVIADRWSLKLNR